MHRSTWVIPGIFLGLLLAQSALMQPVVAQPAPCGLSPNDWCPAPAGDTCGRHRDAQACKADSACFGMLYRGESAVACRYDARGFAANCPTVGCTGTRPAPPRTP